MVRTGAEIYRNFQDGPGTSGLADAAAMIKTIADECAEDAEAIRQLTAKMEGSWQGEAAGAARRGAAPLATEHQSAATGLSDVEMVAAAEVDFFGSAKNSVVPVPPKPAEPSQWAGFADLAGQYRRYEDQVDDHNAAAKHNVAVMDGYASDAGSVAQQLPTEYGTLSSDGTDVTIGRDTPIKGESDRSVSATEWRRTTESTPDPVPGDDGRQPGDRHRPSESGGQPGPSGPGSQSGPGGAPTRPHSHVPGVPGPVQPGPMAPGGDLGLGQRPTPGSPGLGFVGVPWGDGNRDGLGGTGGRGGSVVVPREGAVPRDGLREGAPRGVASEPQGAARSGTVGGRGGAATTHGVPLGAPAGRRDDDVEHRRPTFLEGDDPEELFGSEVLTAPSTIGAEDED